MPLGCRCGRKRLYCNGVRLSCRHFCSDKALPAKTPGLPKSQAESRLQSKESHHTGRCQKKTILNGCLTIRKRVVGVILAISAVLSLYDLSCAVVMSATPQPRRLQWLEGLLDSMFAIRARMERGTSLPHASHPCADINADIARAGFAGGCCYFWPVRRLK